MFNGKLHGTLKVLTGCGAIFSLLMLWGQEASAAAQSLSDIVKNIQTNVETLGPLLTIISYIAGVAFAIGGIVKFKTHKDNPQQATLSQAIVYLGVGAALLFLPTIMASAGTTVFGGSETSAGKGDTGLQ